ncbi:MAG TPA: amidohydrolase family protein [Acidimicrobiales bacterium]|nr:amidohydrolase family protein [Acidimicrobiales bacterium]
MSSTVTTLGSQERTALPYLVNDADEHSTPRTSAYEQYIDPDKKEMAIRSVVDESGNRTLLYNGRPPRFTFKNFQVVGSNEILEEIGVKDRGVDEETGLVIPGSLLNRLNPLKSLDAEGRKDFAKRYRALQEHLDNPADRLQVMDAQGVEACVNFATLPGTEAQFEGDLPGLYANLTALNRYLGHEWGFNYKNRIFTPPFISFADPDMALAQLEDIMKIEVPKVIQTSTGPSMHTSPFRPENDRFWSICNEAGIRLATHLASLTRYAAQGEEWNEPEVMLGDMDAFQWVFYYGDRPAMETVGAAILQGWFARFPNMKLLLSEQGTVWLPYLIRKMDHAFMMGRRATWGKLTMRPSEYFREHCFVAPFPEENLDRVIEVVGPKPIVFGSDFPHGEGLPDPSAYLGQLKNLSEDDARAVMRGNLARYLDLPA